MAGEIRTTTDSLVEQLREQPFSFDFFQAVRQIECAHPNRPRVGHSQHAAEDPVRFAQVPSLAFAPSTVAEFKQRDSRPAKLSVFFMGVMGPNGPMPPHFTEYVRDRVLNNDDETLASFLDIFHHRAISLFYRAWACNQQTVSHDRRGHDRFADYIGSLFGIGMASFRNRDDVPDVVKLHYSGRLVAHTRNAEGLAAVVKDYFGVDATVEQFTGQWLTLPPEATCRLGKSVESGLMGSTIIVGSKIWDCQQKFRLRLGPMGLAEYQRMLPGGRSLRRLVAWVKNYVGDELEWDARLVLKKEEVPQTRLGKLGQIGWTTWLHTKPVKKDADDLVLRPSAHAA
jgi:type VI secretion system protein ImpH